MGSALYPINFLFFRRILHWCTSGIEESTPLHLVTTSYNRTSAPHLYCGTALHNSPMEKIFGPFCRQRMDTWKFFPSTQPVLLRVSRSTLQTNKINTGRQAFIAERQLGARGSHSWKALSTKRRLSSTVGLVQEFAGETLNSEGNRFGKNPHFLILGVGYKKEWQLE